MSSFYHGLFATLFLGVWPALVAGQEAIQKSPTATNIQGAVDAELAFVEGASMQRLDVVIAIHGMPLRDYWNTTFDEIFDFADVNGDGKLTADELPHVPSAKAVRLSCGTGFVPPVAALKSIHEICENGSDFCTKENLRQYYNRNRVGQLQIGHAALHTAHRRTSELVKLLDDDQDGLLSRCELANAETKLRIRDTNDDELIAATELVPNQPWPDCHAGNVLQPGVAIQVSEEPSHPAWLLRLASGSNSEDQVRILLQRAGMNSGKSAGKPGGRPEHTTIQDVPSATWTITVTATIAGNRPMLSMHTRLLAWFVPGELNELYEGAAGNIRTESLDDMPETSDRSRDRRPSRAWLTPIADRDKDGQVSGDELNRWLALQQRIVAAHVVINMYRHAELFELIDANHDGALSVRELRNAWTKLQDSGWTADESVQCNNHPEIMLAIASHGYPKSLSVPGQSGPAWFLTMDRNGDGDVSRREFTGTGDQFSRTDQDHDGLISAEEASSVVP